jgi:hypothetical protein
MFIKPSRLIFLGLIVLLAIGNVFPAHAQENAESRVFTFKELGYDDLRLRGLYGTNSLWIPFQSDWPVGNVEVELTYTASPLLHSQMAILTILANNQEITSIRPVGDGQNHTIAFVIPAERQLADGISLIFDGHLRLTDEFCEDSFNVGQWLIIRNSSLVRVNLNDSPPAPNLADLPHAIVVEGNGDDIPPVVFILPDQPDETSLTVAAQIAGRLGKNIQPGNLPLQVATPLSLTDENKQNANLVIIGLNSKQALIQELASSMPVPPSAEGFVSQDNRLIPETDGVVQIFGSPWNVRHRILLVSGNAEAGIKMAGQAFADLSTFQSLTSSFQFVHTLVNRVDSAQGLPWVASQTSFSQLGEFDRQVTGLGITDSYYFFHYPAGAMLTEDARLTFHLAFSPALRTQNSYALVYINDVYIGSINANRGDEDSWVALDLPVQKLNQLAREKYGSELNLKLSIANLLPSNSCEQIDKESSWTKIYADSYFQLGFSPVDLPDLYFFPYPFVSVTNHSPVRFILPENPTPIELQTALSVAALLGNNLSTDLNIDMQRVSAKTAAALAGHQLILLGTPERNSLLGEVLAGSQTSIPLDLYQFLSAPQVGFFHALKSPWDPNMNVLAIYGDAEVGFDTASKSIFENGRLVNESGSIAMVRLEEEPVVIYREAGLPTPQVMHPEVLLPASDQQEGASSTPDTILATESNPAKDDKDDSSTLTSTERMILLLTVLLIVLVAAVALIRIAWRIRA